MFRFTGKHSARDGWLRNIQATANRELPCRPDGNINGQFPWIFLKGNTNSYLHKKGSLNQEEKDARLLALIKVCGNKPIALAAAGHAMSAQTLKELLAADLYCSPSNFTGMHQYLQTLYAVSQVNPQAVGEQDGRYARMFVPCFTEQTPSVSRKLMLIKHLLSLGLSKETLIHGHVIAALSYYCIQFNTELQALAIKGQWATIAAETDWLAELSQSTHSRPSGVEFYQILNDALPEWQAWATWKPNRRRLESWRTGLTTIHAALLRDVLALEGPDKDCRQHPTKLQHVLQVIIEQPGSDLYVLNDSTLMLCGKGAAFAENIMRRTLVQVDRIAQATVACKPYLVKYLGFRLFDEEKLKILELISESNNVEIIKGVTMLDSNEVNDINITTLIGALDGAAFEHLRSLFFDKIKELVLKQWDDLYVGIVKLLRSNTGTTTALRPKIQGLQQLGLSVRFAHWILDGLEPNLRDAFMQWPSSNEATTWFNLYLYAGKNSMRLLLRRLDMYLCCRFTATRWESLYIDNAESFRMIESLMLAYPHITTITQERLMLNLANASTTAHECHVAIACLAQIPRMDNNFVLQLLAVLPNYNQPSIAFCAEFANVLGAQSSTAFRECWRPWLSTMIERIHENILKKALELGIESFFTFMSNIETIFSDQLNMLTPRPWLDANLHSWLVTLAPFLDVLEFLGESEGMIEALHFLVLAGCKDEDMTSARSALPILEHLQTLETIGGRRRRQVITQGLKLSMTWGNDLSLLGEFCSFVPLQVNGEYALCNDTIESCLDLLNMYSDSQNALSLVSEGMCEAQLCAMLCSNTTSFGTDALCALQEFLGLEGGEPEDAAFEMLDAYVQSQLFELTKEAERLEGLRLALKGSDPTWLAETLEELGIEDESPLATMISQLPSELSDLVEQIDEHQLEIQLPLAFTNFQKAAMGIPNARSLLVRIVTDLRDSSFPPSFCVHFDGDAAHEAYSAAEHSPWICFQTQPARNKSKGTNKSVDTSDWSTLPTRAYCHGRSNLAVLNVSRTLARHFSSGFTSLAEICETLTTCLSTLSRNCLACGLVYTRVVGRAVVCANTHCQAAFQLFSAEVSMHYIRYDPLVVDLLLSTVHAVSLANPRVGSSSWTGKGQDMTFLPSCPSLSITAVSQVLTTLPPICELQQLACLEDEFRSKATEQAFLHWLCNSFKGYLVSATGQLKLPSLPPQTHQFVLANASAQQEEAFAKHVATAGGQTKGYFHGTTLDCLYSILTHGLQVKSGTTHARNGSSFGSGIYLAEEMSLAYGYANASLAPTVGKNWRHGSFCGSGDIRVVLGVELAGSSSPASSGIHVIPDASRVMLRYIFLMPPGAACPVSRHVVPAMESVFAGLRAGTI